MTTLERSITKLHISNTVLSHHEDVHITWLFAMKVFLNELELQTWCRSTGISFSTYQTEEAKNKAPRDWIKFYAYINEDQLL